MNNSETINLIYRYRFLEETDTNGSYIRTLGLAYDEREELSEESRSVSFIYGRLEHTYGLVNQINNLADEDISQFPDFKGLNCRWSDINTIFIQDYENSNWSIAEPILERRKQDSLTKKQGRKIA